MCCNSSLTSASPSILQVENGKVQICPDAYIMPDGKYTVTMNPPASVRRPENEVDVSQSLVLDSGAIRVNFLFGSKFVVVGLMQKYRYSGQPRRR